MGTLLHRTVFEPFPWVRPGPASPGERADPVEFLPVPTQSSRGAPRLLPGLRTTPFFLGGGPPRGSVSPNPAPAVLPPRPSEEGPGGVASVVVEGRPTTALPQGSRDPNVSGLWYEGWGPRVSLIRPSLG